MPISRPIIAIVDDEEPVRVALRRLCGASGLEPRAFAGAEQLFESLNDHLPDCLILDAQMPRCGGVETHARLLARGIDIPVIMITGREDGEMRAHSIAIGARAYLSKPIDADLLLSAIRHALGARAELVE